jgi:anti-sigma B factor antagonist
MNTTPGKPGTTPAEITVRTQGPITIIEFLDRRLIDPAQIERLGQHIHAMVSTSNVPKFILNFEKVEYLSSSALNILISLENVINKKGGKLRLACLHADLQKVFKLMKLTKVMVLCETMDEALQSVK